MKALDAPQPRERRQNVARGASPGEPIQSRTSASAATESELLLPSFLF